MSSGATREQDPAGEVSKAGIVVAAAFLVASLVLFGYGAAMWFEASAPDLSPRTFLVDDPGVRYLWYDMRRGLSPASRLADVPSASRSTAVVLGPGWPRGEDRRDDGWYVADVRDVVPGDQAWARWSGRAELVSHAHASARALDRVLGVRVLAMELANVNPRSERRKASVRAIQTFHEEIVPTIRDTRPVWER